MIEKIKKAVNWANWHLGGLRDEDCMFATCGPVEAAAWEGLTADVPPAAA